MASRRPTFPRTVVEFQRRFPTEEACEAYLAECRWPDGFACPRCGHRKAWAHAARRLRECAACGYGVSTTAGTILHRTRTPLLTWFWAAFLMIIDKRGLSALGLQRQLGIARYETAWMLLHKLRRATVNFNRTKLRGTVEVDEAWIGGKQPGTRTRGRAREGRRAALVVLALGRAGLFPARLRPASCPTTPRRRSSASYRRWWSARHRHRRLPGYLALPSGFHERIVGATGRPSQRPASTTRSATSELDLGTHKGVSRDHLASYLDEFVFRHNRRTNLGAAFQTLLGLGTSREPTTYATITGAQDLPKITYAPSVKVSGVRRRRARFTPAPPTFPDTPEA